MTPELWILIATIGLAAGQMGLAAILQHRQTGVTFAVGPRDEAFELTGMAGRMTRALRNLHETLAMVRNGCSRRACVG